MCTSNEFYFLVVQDNISIKFDIVIRFTLGNVLLWMYFSHRVYDVVAITVDSGTHVKRRSIEGRGDHQRWDLADLIKSLFIVEHGRAPARNSIATPKHVSARYDSTMHNVVSRCCIVASQPNAAVWSVVWKECWRGLLEISSQWDNGGSISRAYVDGKTLWYIRAAMPGKRLAETAENVTKGVSRFERCCFRTWIEIVRDRDNFVASKILESFKKEKLIARHESFYILFKHARSFSR